MKRSLALSLQVAVVLIGLVAVVLLLWEPQVEGRNAHAEFFEIYFKDPFLAYVYLGSTPFFVGLYRAFALFGHVRQTGAFSQVTVGALRSIKHCAVAVIGFVAGGMVFIALFGDKDDRPAGFFMGLLVTVAASAVATAAATFSRRLENILRRSSAGRD
jgi:hypothetical protein